MTAGSAVGVVSAARVLLDALRWQPNVSPDVREAVSMLCRALDRHDAADPALRRAAGRGEPVED
ncbi:hypothetical protein [Micromonospora tulbaghiae]|uniref:hypothetical protein n=1 Tax=Micromonospora tulbaghiae TaxID=479978 RepID=UPI0033C3246B